MYERCSRAISTDYCIRVGSQNRLHELPCGTVGDLASFDRRVCHRQECRKWNFPEHTAKKPRLACTPAVRQRRPLHGAVIALPMVGHHKPSQRPSCCQYTRREFLGGWAMALYRARLVQRFGACCYSPRRGLRHCPVTLTSCSSSVLSCHRRAKKIAYLARSQRTVGSRTELS